MNEIVSAGVDRARRAQADWAGRAVRERLRVVSELRHRIAAEVERLVTAVGQEWRRSEGETLAAEVLPLAEACRFLERKARSILSPRRLGRRPGPPPVGGVEAEVRREPWGLVLVIGPGNFPLFLPGVQALQALTAGNAVLLKPGKNGAPAAAALADLCADAGLPNGLLTVLDESVEAAKHAIEAGVEKVILTGSAETGRAVLAELAPRLVPAVMELGGSDAVFVMEGADLELVARAVRFGLRLNGGATCIAPRRILAWRAVAGELEQRLSRAVGQLEESAVEERAADRARELVEEALSDGARIAAGDLLTGGRMKPVLVADVRPKMGLARTDVFAPVASLVRVGGVAEALRADAECPYALGASVFGPRGPARMLARRIGAGVVVVNDIIAPTADARLPFGGWDESGFGVTRGTEGLLQMTRPKVVAVARSRFRPHLTKPGPGDERMLRSLITARHGRGLRERAAAAWRLLRGWIKRDRGREQQA
ncbi:MAG: aldehyde dehydrogenase family protein [Planctomycetota bacterium]